MVSFAGSNRIIYKHGKNSRIYKKIKGIGMKILGDTKINHLYNFFGNVFPHRIINFQTEMIRTIKGIIRLVAHIDNFSGTPVEVSKMRSRVVSIVTS